MTVINHAGEEIIKSSESLRLEAYICPAGVWTIGWGHTHGVKPGDRITHEQAQDLFDADVQATRFDVQGGCTIIPNQNQLAAMVSLAFNIGSGAFARSSVLTLHNKGNFTAAGSAFLLWNKATVGGKKVILPGLVSRRAREATLYLEPIHKSLLPQAVEGDAPLTRSRTMIGAATAGVSTMASAAAVVGGVEVGWMPIALTLAGIGMTAYARWSDRQQGTN